MPKSIAILVPSYNSTQTLEGTLRSILALGDDLEAHIDHLMLSDDGSKDDTIALAEWVWDHPTVPLVVKRAAQNVGEYGNVNGAMDALPPHIEWVLLMHSDNQALAPWIKVLARECRRADEQVATICGSWEYIVDETDTKHGDQRGPDHIEDALGNDVAIRSTLKMGCWWHNGCSAIRISAWKAVGGHPHNTPLLSSPQILGLGQPAAPYRRRLRIKGDWDTLLRLLSSGYTVRYVATPLIRYIEFSQSVSSGAFAWHGDLLETLQVLRRHQAPLHAGEIIVRHTVVWWTLTRRLGGAIVRGQWRRAGFAIAALPTVWASVAASLAMHIRGKGGRLAAIPFRY